MADELEVIATELGLPRFKVPAPRNSAMHQSLSLVVPPAAPTTDLSGPRHTRVFTREELPPPTDDDNDEYRPLTGHFAGIDLSEFYWARQRAKRTLFFWVVAVLTVAALAGAGAWTLGANLPNLL